jgi:hypothetical protein
MNQNQEMFFSSPSANNPDLRSSYILEGPARIECSANRECLWSAVLCVYVRVWVASSKTAPITLELDRPQHDRHASCVIAQQCSTYLSLRFNFLKKKKKFGALLKMLLFQSF